MKKNGTEIGGEYIGPKIEPREYLFAYRIKDIDLLCINLHIESLITIYKWLYIYIIN
jgi:hypothetical protein